MSDSTPLRLVDRRPFPQETYRRRPDDRIPVIDGFLPRYQVSLLAGASGSGKTTLIMQLLRSHLAGEVEFLGFRFAPGIQWGYLVNDRNLASYEEAAERVGLNLGHFPLISVSDEASMTTEIRGIDRLCQQLDRLTTYGANVIIVDTLVSWVENDARRYDIVYTAMSKIAGYVNQHDLTVLGTHHTVKSASDKRFDRPQDRISGSAALAGFTSNQITLTSPQENRTDYTSLDVIDHNRPARNIKLTRDDSRGGIFVLCVESVESRAGEREVLEVINQVDGLLVSRGFIDQRLPNISRASVTRALKALKESGKILKEERGLYRLAPVEDSEAA